MRKLGYEKRKNRMGLVFIAPWVLGMALLFILPLAQLLLYSFTRRVYFDEPLNLTGFEQYARLFTKDAYSLRLLIDSIVGIANPGVLLQTVYITILSLFIAYILKNKFFGRTAARALFFLPVIVTSGIVIKILSGDIMASMMMSGEKASIMIRSIDLTQFMIRSGLPLSVSDLLSNLIDNIFNLTWRSGVQILLLLAGLQTVPPNLYEAASIDGATGWETFWFVTFPMVSPVLLVTAVYTLIEGFSDYNNEFQQSIISYARAQDFSYSAALSWVYFIVSLILVGALLLMTRKRMVYLAD